MKNIIIALLLLVILVHAESYRMQLLGKEKHDGYSFEYWHDKETGQEVMCVFGGIDVPSCYLTGRKW